MVSTGNKPWTVHILLNKYPVEFQIDTGADVSVIPEELYKKLKATPLHPTGKFLVGPSQDALKVCGQFSGTLVYKGNTVKEVIYVVKGLRKALVGRPAITALQLVSQVNAVDFSKQDVISKFPMLFNGLGTIEGEYEIKLKPNATKKSALLTTFITPVGRFCFDCLPFGITSAPEFYQKRMSHILSSLPGVVCMIDDILEFGQSQQEHDQRLESVLKRLIKAGITLNSDKCEFSRKCVKFLGHVIDEIGIHADQGKIQAIQQQQVPTNVTELCRFLGMVTYLSKFSPTCHKK